MSKVRSPFVFAASGAAALAVMAGGLLIGGGGEEGEAGEKSKAVAGLTSTAPPVTQPLREEHKQLLPHIDKLRQAGDSVGSAPPAQLRKQTAEAREFLTGHLVPHAQAEDKVLYAEIDRLLAGQPVTATMRRDHVEVARLTEELGSLEKKLAQPPTVQTQLDLRRVLYGSYTLVKLHFAKEEEVYLPILDKRLTAEQAKALFERMEQVGQHGGAGEHGTEGHGTEPSTGHGAEPTTTGGGAHGSQHE